MKKFKIDTGKVGEVIESVGNLVLLAAVVVLPCVTSRDIINKVRYSGNVKYSDAVNATLTGSMYSTDKTKVIAMLPKNGDAELYKSVIQIVNSSLYSSGKVEAIEHICGNLQNETESKET